MTFRSPRVALAALPLLVLVACGGGNSGGGVRGSTVPPPPRIDKSENAAPGKAEPKREGTNPTRQDHQGATQFFASTDKAHGWNDSTCRQAADRFTSVLRSHSDLVE